MKTINISLIRIDGSTQNRARLDSTTVAEYSEALQEGAEFPPVTVFHDGSDYWLADGFHRFHAYLRAKKVSIAVEVKKGDQRAAWLYSLGANDSNGLRRSNEDKHFAVNAALADSELSKWSDREIARQCKVSNMMVGSLRKRLTESSFSEKPTESTYKTKHGTVATMQTAAIGKPLAKTAKPESKPEAAPDDEGAPDQAEFDAQAAAEKAEAMAMRLLLASDKPLADVTAKYQQALLQIERLTARITGLQNESTHQIKVIKSLQSKLKRLEQAA
jgi:uncharacterized ParB-like nuclease family protein